MTKGDSDGNRLFSFLLHARREVSAATRDRQRLGAPHQKHREQRRRRGNRSRQQRRRSESIGECRIADLPGKAEGVSRLLMTYLML